MTSRAVLQEALSHANVRAFLKAIRLGEGTLDDRGYNRIVGGEEFDDFSAHPNKLVYIARYGIHSTAAGAYQFIYRTWHNLQAQYGFPSFDPECQDEAAVALIIERFAIGDVKAGNLRDAVNKCSVEWASLPGAGANQREESFENVKAVYLDNGGTLA